MIGMNNLGLNGRLGNQMFQYAALMGLAYNRSFDWCIPKENQDLTNCFLMKNLRQFGNINGPELHLHESHEFCEDLMFECPDGATLHGYFQSEKYFKHVEGAVRGDFQFKEDILNAVVNDYPHDFLGDAVSLVVRRFEDNFDYPGCENNHRNLSIEYYEKAIEMLGSDRRFIICSNNIDWCKHQKAFQGDNFIFNDKIPEGMNKAFYDLCLISRCKDHIISNSTFSWWGAWLGNKRGKHVIAPVRWYGPNLSDINAEDLFPIEWIRIDL
jgi:hypothetical protein